MVVQNHIYLSGIFRPTYRRSSSGIEKTLKKIKIEKYKLNGVKNVNTRNRRHIMKMVLTKTMVST